MEPFKLVPVFKEYFWGGTRLKTLFNKRTDLPLLAESWELAAHPEGDCQIADGPFAGRTLSAFLRYNPEALGSNVLSKKTTPSAFPKEELPVLIKLIDARENLSVQVHPGDDYPRLDEGGAGKTEMWYIIEREPGAFLYCGFERELSRDELAVRIEDGTITDVLHRIQVEPGDVYFIEAGTVHAIGAGILLAEVQQNSNTTYRVYDYGRKGPDGKARPLHIEKALEVSRRTIASPAPPGSGGPRYLAGGALRRLASCAYFTTELLELSGRLDNRTDGTSFLSLLCLDGTARLTAGESSMKIEKGESVFLAAEPAVFSVEGRACFLLTSVPR